MEDEPVDVALEVSDGGHYQLPTVTRRAIAQAIEKAVADGTTFSLSNCLGGAVVVPWPSVAAVYAISIYATNDVSWDLMWQRPVATQECVPV